jgi:adenylate cyclase
LIREYEKHGAEFAVDMFLEGELAAAAYRFSAAVRLRDAADGADIWSDGFEFDNAIQLQDAITNGASKAILDRMTDGERGIVAKRLPTNLAAYENFQTANRIWRNRGDPVIFFERALEMDQSFARAYVGLAGTKMMSGDASAANDAIQKAFELDDSLADAYAVQGFIRIFHDRDWSGAEKSLLNALDLDGNSVNARHWLAVLRSIQRRLNEAKVDIKLALELDPTNPTLLADLGQLYYFAGKFETATQYCQKALAIDPAHHFAQKYLDRLNETKETDDATLLSEAESAVRMKIFALPYLNVDPRYDPVREDPRFQRIIRSMGL